MVPKLWTKDSGGGPLTLPSPSPRRGPGPSTPPPKEWVPEPHVPPSFPYQPVQEVAVKVVDRRLVGEKAWHVAVQETTEPPQVLSLLSFC